MWYRLIAGMPRLRQIEMQARVTGFAVKMLVDDQVDLGTIFV
jgi:hypothetical protein